MEHSKVLRVKFSSAFVGLKGTQTINGLESGVTLETKRTKQCYCHEIHLFMSNSSKTESAPSSTFPKSHKFSYSGH